MSTPGTVLEGPPSPGISAELLPGLGHELRGPLTGIIGLTRIMLIKLDPGPADRDEQVRQLEMVQASAVGLLATVERLAEIAALERVPAAAPVPFDCRPVLRGALATAEVPAEPLLVLGDPAALARVLDELLDNARRHGDPTGVRVRARVAGPGEVLVEVSDPGPGIPEDEQPRLFEPYVRGRAAARAGTAGAGLGLYLARRLAQRSGARLGVSSWPGEGTTATVHLRTAATPVGGT